MGHIHIKRRKFRQVTDTSLRLYRLFVNIVTVYFDGSLRRGKAAGYDIHSRGFSGAVGTEKAVYMTAFDIEIQMVNSVVRPVFFCKILYFYQIKSSPEIVLLFRSGTPMTLRSLAILYFTSTM